MAFSVLKTKVVTPSLRTELVQRRRLFDLLNQSAHSRLVLVNAPAGYGKSTIVNAWVQDIEAKIAWFAIDKGDNEFAVFLTYLITAFRNAYPRFGQHLLSALAEDGQIHNEAILTALVNELTELSSPTVVVFDDYHLIEKQEIHAAVVYFIEHLPATVRILVISRAEPPFPLHRWRGRDELIEIRATDLRFTLEETQKFLKRVMKLELDSENVQTLEKRTEGWVTGLQMAGLAIKALSSQLNGEQAAISDFVRTFSSSHRYILDYLRDEVINHQPLHIRDFLLHTSILEEMTALLCNAVLQIENSQEILEHLENQNLFLIALDGERQWYRYHHLFAELLQTNLQEEDAESIPKLHLRASQWYAQNNDANHAIVHALASKRTDEIITLAENLLLDLYEDGNLDQSRHWIEKLPIEIVRSRPLLCLAQSITSTYTHHFDYDRAESWAVQAQKTDPSLLNQRVNRAGLPYDTVGNLVGAYIARYKVTLLRLHGRTPDEIIRAAEQALAVTPEGDYAAHSSMWMAISRSYLSDGKAAEAEQAIQRAIGLSELSGKQSIIVSAFWTQAYIAYWQGHLQTASKIYQRTYSEYIYPVEQKGEYLSSASVLYTFWATVLREMNQLDEAKRLFLKSQEQARFRNLADTALDNEVGLAWIATYRGIDSGIKALEKRLPDLPAKKVEMVQRHTAGMKLFLGDRQPEWSTSVFQWADEQVIHLKPMEQLESHYLIWVRALLLRQRWGKPIPDLRGVLEPLTMQQLLAEAGHFLRSQIEILILKALVYQTLGDIGRAVEAIGNALALAQPEGYVRIFINEGALIAPLLQAASEEGITPGYILVLLQALEEEIPTQGMAATPQSGQPLIDPLTPRELEVLQLVATGLSNQEIAAQLVLAPGTVKKYLSSVFQKLNVNRRTQAVARAQALQIL